MKASKDGDVYRMTNVLGKRFVFFNGTLMQGGAERVISILSKKMVERGMNVSILLYHDREIFYDIDSRVKIKIVEKESKSTNIVKNISWIREYFSKNADVILSFLAPFNIVALVANMGLKSKIIVADRNDPRYIPSKKAVRELRNWLYRSADGIVIQTTQNLNYFSKKVREKSIVIPNPIDLGDKAGLALRTPKEKKVVSVGRLMPQKNQELLIKAFGQIHEQYPEHRLVIYGEGPYRDYLERVISELHMTGYVVLAGSSKNVFDDIAGAELFVLSSNYEGMPNALIEAMCLGLPCISTRVSGATDLIQNGINGELIDVGDAQELAKAIDSLLSDEERRRHYGAEAEVLNSTLAVDVVIDKWIRYISIISGETK